MTGVPMLLLLAVTLPVSAVSIKSRPCSGGSEAAKIRLEASKPSGGEPRSLSRLKRIEPGMKVVYRPIELPADVKDKAKVVLIAQPVEPSAGNESALRVLSFHPAGLTAEWTLPFRASLIVFALGPQGLDEKRVNNLVAKDDELIAALADYADLTAEIEATVAALTAMEAGEGPDAEPEGSILDLSDPTDQALFALLRALNPSLMAGNPLGAGRRVGPVTLASKAAVGFFDNAGGIVPGGGALSEVKSWLFPDTEFRAAFVQEMGTSLSLCVPRVAARSRNRQVYLWARHILDSGPPRLAYAGSGTVPIGARSSIVVKPAQASDWALAPHIDHWRLEPVGRGPALPVKVQPSPQRRLLEIDLRGFPGAPGKYRLRGEWDWETVTLEGEIELAHLGDLARARLAPESALIAGGGKSLVTLEGADFQFMERVAIKSAGGVTGAEKALEFFLSKGARQGVQARLDVELDTRDLRPGQYLLVLQQAGGSRREVPVQVQPDTVRIENLPLILASSPGPQRIVLRGADLDKLTALEAEGVRFRLEPAGATGSERAVVAELTASAGKGEKRQLLLAIAGVEGKRPVANALFFAGPRPLVARKQVAAPAELGIQLEPGELPAGSHITAVIEVEASEPIAALRLLCGASQMRLRLGERTAFASLAQTSEKVLFLSLDPGAAGAPGCELQASVESSGGLASEPAVLGRVLRIPRIESIAFTGERLPDGAYAALLTGTGLETIEKTGWNSTNGVPVRDVPVPLAGQDFKQTLRVGMPWPSPAPRSAVYVWLRGEQQGRATAVKY